jgi:hypothetical protein
MMEALSNITSYKGIYPAYVAAGKKQRNAVVPKQITF